MDGVKDTPVARNTKTNWIKYVLVVLVIEKIIQHITVTLAFYANWKDIRSTVAISPDLLMVSGAVVAILFALSLWGLVTHKSWAPGLIIGLSLFDILGEFVAQGTIAIMINVSFLVAIILLILSLLYRRQGPRRAEQ